MQTIELLTEDLVPYLRNAKKHDKRQIDNVAESIKQFGFVQPIVIDNENNIIIGHCRTLAAKKLGIEKVPCVKMEDLTPEQANKLRLLDNKLNESDWDFELLSEDVPELDFDGFDIDFGIDVETEEDTEVVEDDFDAELPEEPKAKIGDIYQLGNHRLMCGDSTDVLNIEKLFDNAKIDLVLSDPPYGVNVVSNDGKVGADFGIAEKGNYLSVKGDETTDTAKDFYNSCISCGIDKFILFGGNYFTDFLSFSDGWLIWDKRCDSGIKNTFADGEMAWCSFHTPLRIYHQLWNGMIREGEYEKRLHPTQKPIRMLADIIKDFSEVNENIFDGFGGSGSTLIACEQTERNCFMIEYEPHYVDVIIERWEKFTGKKAVLLND